MTNKNDDHENKRKKLYDFENWSQWAEFILAMLEKKELWDIVDGSCANPTIATQTGKKKEKQGYCFSNYQVEG